MIEITPHFVGNVYAGYVERVDGEDIYAATAFFNGDHTNLAVVSTAAEAREILRDEVQVLRAQGLLGGSS